MHKCMNALLQNLIRLQAIEFEETNAKNAKTVIAELRATIPPQILGHYDRLVAKGKKGITAIRGQVCSGCHMTVPVGIIATLKRDEDIQLCENCGRYLYLLDTPEPEPAAPAPVARPKRGRKPRVQKREMNPA
jgi:predicted  nucleic acid-binding Zn-ribbon protein